MKHREDFPKPEKEIYRIVQLIIAIGFVRFLASTYPGFRALMNLVFEHTLRLRYFNAIVEKDYKFFNKYRTGDLVTRLTDDLSDYPRISWFLCSGIFRAFDSFNKIIFCLIVMFGLNWKLTLLSISPLPVMVTIFYIVSEKLYKTYQRNQEAISEINNQLEMSFAGVRIIKSFVCENKYKRFFNKALENRLGTEMNVVKLDSAIRLVYEYIGYFAQIGIISFGGYMVVKEQISVGTFVAFYAYLGMIIYPILDLPNLFVSGKQAFVNIDRLEDIKDFPVTVHKERANIKIDKIESIEFRNVQFRYEENNHPVLKNINFSTKKGEKVVILGSVGSGKSTILGLLTGTLLAEKGEILINDIPLNKIDLIDFREKVGYVPQEPLLFSGSIKDNIAFGKDDPQEDFYRQIIRAVKMENEIENFTDKDDTVLGQRGLSLSGGQKQRLAIARALIKKPEILVLDDITASLDADNEEKLWREINSMFEEISCFIVSNRLSTIRYVDNVIFLDSGTIVGKGQHDNMLNQYPEYKSFIEEHYQKTS